MPIKFTVPTVPIAQPRQRTRVRASKAGKSFAQNYTPAKAPVNVFKAAIQLAFAAARHRDGWSLSPVAGPIALVVVFYLPRPKSKLWKRKPMPAYPHTGKPDSDNMVKAIKDALSKLAWRDDSQVWDTRSRKWVCAGDDSPHVYCEIIETDQPQW